jgi:RNA polymerase sigma factor (sigma-70 family)
LSDVADIPLKRAADVVALDDVLKSLEAFGSRKCRVVELRFFGGLSLEETAEALDVSVATVRRDWSLARAWLYRELGGSPRDR